MIGKTKLNQLVAVSSGMTYHIISGANANKGNYEYYFQPEPVTATARQETIALD